MARTNFYCGPLPPALGRIAIDAAVAGMELHYSLAG